VSEARPRLRLGELPGRFYAATFEFRERGHRLRPRRGVVRVLSERRARAGPRHRARQSKGNRRQCLFAKSYVVSKDPLGYHDPTTVRAPHLEYTNEEDVALWEGQSIVPIAVSMFR